MRRGRPLKEYEIREEQETPLFSPHISSFQGSGFLSTSLLVFGIWFTRNPSGQLTPLVVRVLVWYLIYLF